MPRSKKGNTKVPKKEIPPLTVFLQAELERRNMTLVELAERTKIPEATLGRIYRGEVREPKGSIVSKIARGLGMKYAELAAIMGISDDEPGTIESETAQVAAILTHDESLRPLVQKAIRLSPKSRKAVLAYIRHLEEAQNGSQSLEGES